MAGHATGTDVQGDNAAGRAADPEKKPDNVAGHAEVADHIPGNEIDEMQVTTDMSRSENGADNGCSCDSANQQDVFAWVGLLLVIFLRRRRKAEDANP